jgi:DNA repair protein RecO (recombination protein O)
MSEPVKLSGVVLRTVDCGEADRVVTLLTEERGRVAAFARSARASRRRFGGALEPFTQVRAEARVRRASELLSLESVSPVRAFAGIRADLARIACAGYACELAGELLRENEPNRELHALLVDYLSWLDARAAAPSALRAYELAALAAAGLRPCLSGCARCGGVLEGPAHRFDPAEGGAVCARCAAPGAPAGLRVARPTLEALARLQAGGLAAAEREPLAGEAGAEARDALSAFVEHHLGKRLAARRFLDEVGPMLR